MRVVDYETHMLGQGVAPEPGARQGALGLGVEPILGFGIPRGGHVGGRC